MDKLKAKLLEAMSHDNFKLQDFMQIVFDEVKELEDTIAIQQDELMQSMSIELNQKDEIKRLKNQILELDIGNQNKLKSLESLHKAASGLYKENEKLRLELMWKDRE